VGEVTHGVGLPPLVFATGEPGARHYGGVGGSPSSLQRRPRTSRLSSTSQYAVPRLGLNFTTNDGHVSRPAFRRDTRVRDAIRAPAFNDTPQIGRYALRRRRHDLGSVRGEGKVGAQAVT
jgi:hypothetical protein